MVCQFLQKIKDKVLSNQEVGNYQFPSEEDSIAQENSNLQPWLIEQKLTISQIRDLIRKHFNLDLFVKRYSSLVKLFYQSDYSASQIISRIAKPIEDRYNFIYQDLMIWFENDMIVSDGRTDNRPAIVLAKGKDPDGPDLDDSHPNLHYLYSFKHYQNKLENYFKPYFTDLPSDWDRQQWRIKPDNIYMLNVLVPGTRWDTNDSFEHRMVSLLLNEDKKITSIDEPYTAVMRAYFEMENLVSKQQTDIQSQQIKIKEKEKEISSLKQTVTNLQQQIDQMKAEQQKTNDILISKFLEMITMKRQQLELMEQLNSKIIEQEAKTKRRLTEMDNNFHNRLRKLESK